MEEIENSSEKVLCKDCTRFGTGGYLGSRFGSFCIVGQEPNKATGLIEGESMSANYLNRNNNCPHFKPLPVSVPRALCRRVGAWFVEVRGE